MSASARRDADGSMPDGGGRSSGRRGGGKSRSSRRKEGVVYTTRRGEGVTRDMINTRRSELLSQIKEVESVLSRERRRTRRVKDKTARLRAQLSTAGSSVVGSPRTSRSAVSSRRSTQFVQQGETKNAAHYFREHRKGMQMAMLMKEGGAEAKFEDMTTTKATHEYRPESVRAELDADWDLRHPRHQTELTRYVDVVIRQNLPPFQSTAMMP